MSKSSKNNRRKNKKNKKPDSQYKILQRPSKNWSGFVLRNLFIGLIFFMLFNSLFENNKAYHWVYQNLLKNNLEIIKEHPDYTMNQKHQAKLGFFAKYLYFVTENTPDTAIILMPPDSIVDKIDKKYKMDWIRSKRHTTYFLYPRKTVYYKNERDSIYFDKITHVAIVNGYGYEHLPYRVQKRNQFTVLPIDIKKEEE